MAKDLKITDLDKNLTVASKIEGVDNLRWINATENCFKVYGAYLPSLYPTDGSPSRFVRMDPDVAAQVNENVCRIYRYTTGIRVRFKTDSEYIAISSRWDFCQTFPHATLLSTCGFDLYRDADGKSRYVNSFLPWVEDVENNRGYESIYHFESREMREITINLPVYNPVNELYIGVEDTAKVERPREYKDIKPVVYYGSSITQGGCASRPGNTYQSMISRALDLDFINLGFSDGARGEAVMADYLADLDMSIFICDYDHNAKTHEMLEATHYPLYKKIREKHPDIPYICISRPCPVKSFGAPLYGEGWDFEERKRIIMDTVNRAKAEGDENIYFIDGATFFEGEGCDCCTVDTIHPTDLGMFKMAQKLAPIIADCLGIETSEIL